MTTKAREKLYKAQHNVENDGKKYVVYNPHNKPLNELTVIYGFNNGGSTCFLHAQLLASDGKALGSHLCSHQDYMYNDLAILEGCREDRHEYFRQNYPGGYKMDFVKYEDVASHKGLQDAIKLNQLERANHEN